TKRDVSRIECRIGRNRFLQKLDRLFRFIIACPLNRFFVSFSRALRHVEIRSLDRGNGGRIDRFAGLEAQLDILREGLRRRTESRNLGVHSRRLKRQTVGFSDKLVTPTPQTGKRKTSPQVW